GFGTAEVSLRDPERAGDRKCLLARSTSERFDAQVRWFLRRLAAMTRRDQHHSLGHAPSLHCARPAVWATLPAARLATPQSSRWAPTCHGGCSRDGRRITGVPEPHRVAISMR